MQHTDEYEAMDSYYDNYKKTEKESDLDLLCYWLDKYVKHIYDDETDTKKNLQYVGELLDDLLECVGFNIKCLLGDLEKLNEIKGYYQATYDDFIQREIRNGKNQSKK